MNLEQIFSTVWNMSLTGSVAICFVLLARLLLKKVPKVYSYCLWAVVLFRLLCPVSISSVFSVMNFTNTPEVVSHGAVSSMDYAAVGNYLDMPLLTVPGQNEPAHEEPDYHYNPITEIPENEPVITSTPDAGSQQATAEPVRDPIRYAVIIWLVGMGAMLILNAVSCIRLFGQLTGAVHLRQNVYIGDHIPTPFVLGFVKPRIYLPSTLDVSERRYIIAHEKTHIRRGDHRVRLLAYLALCLHWFNPLVWLAFSLSGKDMEMSCDEAVIRMYGPRIRAEYSASLLRLATGRRSFALTPLAFGEGDTKGRVMNMAKWKKPGIWATIFALLMCVVVLAACGMNPRQKAEPKTNDQDFLTTEPADTTVFLWDEDTDAEEICIEAIAKLVQADSYYLDYRYHDAYGYGNIAYRRFGDNLAMDLGGNIFGSRLYYDGQYALHLGDYWVWQGDTPDNFDPNEWLLRWSPEEHEIKSWTVGANTISFYGKWQHQLYKDQYYEGTITYVFKSDGSLEYIERDYALYPEDQPVTATQDRITVMAETAQDTEAAIRAIAKQCITNEELDRVRSEQDAITEIPSNKTDYDRDYELGASRMGWEFFSDTWMFKLGIENATSTSVTIVHCESNSGHSALVAGNAFWLEELVDGKWQYVDVMKQSVTTEAHSIDVSWDREDTFVLDWSDSYGELAPGYYRIGRYYTVTLENGNTETRPCYAKFRLHDPNQEVFLRICRDGMENLLDGNYHIRTYQLIENDIFDSFRAEEWKYGNDRMSRSEDVLSDGSPRLRGAILRDGEGYALTWENHDVTKRVIMWERLHYMSETNFLMWSYDFELYDSMIDKVTKEGDTITVWMKNRDDFSHDRKRISFTFDENGKLKSAVRTLMLEDGSTKVANSIEVLDTPESEIKKLIDMQDMSKPMPVFYAEDVAV